MRIAELTIKSVYVGNCIEERRKVVGDDIYNDEFFEYEPDLRNYFIDRDKELLEMIQEDKDLRYYIEKKLGKKAEEIFNYANCAKLDK